MLATSPDPALLLGLGWLLWAASHTHSTLCQALPVLPLLEGATSRSKADWEGWGSRASGPWEEVPLGQELYLRGRCSLGCLG